MTTLVKIAEISMSHGIIAAIRIRVIHCIVMILLYRRNQQLIDNVSFIFSSVKDHSLNLGTFAFFFKILQGLFFAKGSLTKHQATFFAGLLSGYCTWGKSKTTTSYQIFLYILSRDLASMGSSLKEVYFTDHDVYPLVTGLAWGTIMAIHSINPNKLQEGLKSSMDSIYNAE